MSDTASTTLYSGGARGAEAAFGTEAERLGLDEINYTFPGHEPERTRGLIHLGEVDLSLRDVSLQYVSRLMGRIFPDDVAFRNLLRSICWQVASGHEAFVVGEILPDNTVRGGTGWGAEFAKICNKPLFVYCQNRKGWHRWEPDHWVTVKTPTITRSKFTGTGTRSLTEDGALAIVQLFERSFR